MFFVYGRLIRLHNNFEFIFYNQLINIYFINCLAENFIIHIAGVRVLRYDNVFYFVIHIEYLKNDRL